MYGNRTFQSSVLKNVPFHLLILYQIVKYYSIAVLQFTPHSMTHLATAVTKELQPFVSLKEVVAISPYCMGSLCGGGCGARIPMNWIFLDPSSWGTPNQ